MATTRSPPAARRRSSRSIVNDVRDRRVGEAVGAEIDARVLARRWCGLSDMAYCCAASAPAARSACTATGPPVGGSACRGGSVELFFPLWFGAKEAFINVRCTIYYNLSYLFNLARQRCRPSKATRPQASGISCFSTLLRPLLYTLSYTLYAKSSYLGMTHVCHKVKVVIFVTTQTGRYNSPPRRSWFSDWERGRIAGCLGGWYHCGLGRD